MPEITNTTFLVLFVCLSLFAIPAALVLKRLGRHPAWALLCYVPILALVGLWVLAFSPRTGNTA